MITGLPLHHHDMEAGIICDKNGESVINVKDNLDTDEVIRHALLSKKCDGFCIAGQVIAKEET